MRKIAIVSERSKELKADNLLSLRALSDLEGMDCELGCRLSVEGYF